jgi:AcrR family transcriptional regulator
MSARAEAAEATGERILDAALELFGERPTDQIPLDEVASRAGVSVQTVIRRFGGKEGLLAAAVDREASRVSGQRDQAPTGDVAGAVKVLVDHYEELGDRVLRLLGEEDRIPWLRETPIEAVSTTGSGAPGCSLRPWSASNLLIESVA